MLDRGILFNSSRSSGYFSLRRTSRSLFRILLLHALFSPGYFGTFNVPIGRLCSPLRSFERSFVIRNDLSLRIERLR